MLYPEFHRYWIHNFWEIAIGNKCAANMLQHIAAALLVAAASWNLVGSMIRLQRYIMLSFIFNAFIIYEKLPCARNVLQICCNLQHTVTRIKGGALQIDRACKNTPVTQVWHTFLDLNPRPIDVLQICCNMLQFAAYHYSDQEGSPPDW